ncbi:MAG: nucleotidyltransferase domain-containing protein [Firmicutes bacterium]|nr:nucleotidyltransferase domain-containing protein [Bacillota bacterium]
MLTIGQISNGVKQAAREFPIRRAELFGSYARGTATEKSDVDLLVEFDDPIVSLFTLSALRFRMQELLGRSVDVIHSPVPADALIEIDRKIPVYEA